MSGCVCHDKIRSGTAGSLKYIIPRMYIVYGKSVFDKETHLKSSILPRKI